MGNRNLKNWTNLFKGFGNVNRLRILQLLTERKEMSVSELCEKLGISFKNTSRNLAILSNLGVVEYRGHEGKVFYFLSPSADGDVRTLLRLFNS